MREVCFCIHRRKHWTHRWRPKCLFTFNFVPRWTEETVHMKNIAHLNFQFLSPVWSFKVFAACCKHWYLKKREESLPAIEHKNNHRQHFVFVSLCEFYKWIHTHTSVNNTDRNLLSEPCGGRKATQLSCSSSLPLSSHCLHLSVLLTALSSGQ